MPMAKIWPFYLSDNIEWTELYYVGMSYQDIIEYVIADMQMYGFKHYQNMKRLA